MAGWVRMPVGDIFGGVGCALVFWLMALGLLGTGQAEERIDWQFPTENRALVANHPEKFYQPTISRRLISGMFGFVRTAGAEPARMFEHFHKGIDIRPLHRDALGEPTDEVRASADGEVVRVNLDEKISDYGKQVIVRHLWGSQPVYTIYGHLASACVQVGQRVKAGDQVGVMGWTGPGLTKDRAHLHLEIAFQLNEKFADWVKASKPGRFWEPNRNGEWNGLNLMGVDPAVLLKAAQDGKPMSCGECLSSQPAGFAVRVPVPRGRIGWMQWVEKEGIGIGEQSWDLEMTPWGLPLRARGRGERVEMAELGSVPGRPNEGRYYCRGLVGPDGKGGMKLSKLGEQTMGMLLYAEE